MQPHYKVLLLAICLGLSASPSAEDGRNDPLRLGPVVSEDVLSSTRGLGGAKSFLQLNDMDLDSNLSNNIVYSSSNGDNNISHDAFSETSGFATVIQNSGNHVIIQNATIVNFTLKE